MSLGAFGKSRTPAEPPAFLYGLQGIPTALRVSPGCLADWERDAAALVVDDDDLLLTALEAVGTSDVPIPEVDKVDYFPRRQEFILDQEAADRLREAALENLRREDSQKK